MRSTNEYLWDRLYEFANSRPEHCLVLEVGCGNGWFGKRMFKDASSVLLLGVDIDSEALLKAQGEIVSIPRTEYIRADMRHLPFHQFTFDCIIVNMTLHHLNSLEDVELTLQSLGIITKQEGSLMVNEITYDNPLEILGRIVFFHLPMIFRNKLAKGDLEAFHPHPTISFTCNKILADIALRGFRIVELFRYGGLLTPFSFVTNKILINHKVRLQVELLDEVVTKRLFASLQRTVFIVATKRSDFG